MYCANEMNSGFSLRKQVAIIETKNNLIFRYVLLLANKITLKYICDGCCIALSNIIFLV